MAAAVVAPFLELEILCFSLNGPELVFSPALQASIVRASFCPSIPT